ncbi:hypothetical protein [Pseudomonas sp. MYb185]|uniref:hypothetical protein n=1 Tax=Pseudomonas sp. MYb185 TaxID=1848729 RepID=UPI000CFD97C6|nr:hypothetical protein [Pseudomonas sp. MYb185]PRB84484.1 hypothetical protein CQ007_01535 [Pseudomonas sp. MYb185]
MRTPIFRLSIAQRLGLGFGLVLAMMMLVTTLGILRVGFMDNLLTQSNQSAIKQRYAINFRGSVHDRAISARDAVLAENPRELNEHPAEITRLDGFYQDSATPLNRLVAQGLLGAEPREAVQAIHALAEGNLHQNILRIRDATLEPGGSLEPGTDPTGGATETASGVLQVLMS